jgi:cell division protein FtsQ
MDRHGSTREISRARQRKMKRDKPVEPSSQNGAGSSRRSTPRQRPSRRTGPSIRERLASSHINLPATSIQSIQGKLTSKLGRKLQHPETEKKSTKLFLSSALLANRHRRRKNENQRNETHYESTSRSETQRKSNAGQTFISRKNHRVYDTRSEAVPPVMVRGGMGGMAFGRVASSRLHKQKTPKRRFDIPLRMPGAEVRLPSLPFIHIGWRAVSLLMVIMMAASLFLIWKAPVFQVTAVEAEGLKRLTIGDLNAVMGTFGDSVFTINPQKLEEVLRQAFPELANISVKVNLPADVKVEVVEREPVIAWSQDGNEAWVDAQGVAFPPRGTPENALVRVEGRGNPPGIKSSASMSDLQSLPGGMPTSTPITMPSISLSPTLVAAILALGAKVPTDTLLVYDSEHGLGWNDPAGWEVFFGSEDQDMPMKVSVYEALVNRLQNEGIQPEMISVEYVHAPYYRMER